MTNILQPSIHSEAISETVIENYLLAQSGLTTAGSLGAQKTTYSEEVITFTCVAQPREI